MEEIVNIRIKLPNELNLKLEQHQLDLKKIGVKITKESLILKLTRIGLLAEKITE